MEAFFFQLGAQVTVEYQRRLSQFSGLQNEEAGRGLRLGWARAVVFSIGCLFYLGWDVTSGTAAVVCGVGAAFSILVFMGLVAWHRRVRARRKRFEALADINRIALSRIARQWSDLPPSSMCQPVPDHPYAFDLDVCGGASLFRLLTSVTLPPGLETLRSWLLEPAAPEKVRRRQEAVAELAPLVDFRQELEVRGRLLESPSPESIGEFLEWVEEDGWLAGRGWVVVGARALPALTAILLVLNFQGSVGAVWWLLTMAASLGFGSWLRRAIHPLMEAASGGQERFGRYAKVLGLLLHASFEAGYLKNLQEIVRSSPVGAEEELRRLERQVGWADIRHSPMAHAPLQAFLVWDVHILAGLERWKARSGKHVRGWLSALGELEALSALASLRADHPDWCFPTLSEPEGLQAGADGKGARLIAKKMGHPLLPPENCVRNDIELGPSGSFLFVTGSNMSGKSTLLRAVGINAVLAQAGGPVCAESMAMPPVRVQTSMRTADSLAEGVSQYMAELNRIRSVVDGARGGGFGTVLFLLDEPLQGTNEAERRIAVQTILGHLLDAGAIGAVATHDLHLDETDRLRAAAESVHLEGSVREGESGPLLNFDYLLKPGRATSTNALALLRAVGLGGERRPGPVAFPPTSHPNPSGGSSMASSKASTVKEYLEELPEDRRAVVSQVRDVILKNLPGGFQETMNWGMIAYEVPLERYPDTYNKQPLLYMALAAQKNHYAVYTSGIYMDPKGRSWLKAEFDKAQKKLDMGKSCIRFKKLENLPLEVIGMVAGAHSVEGFIEIYEKVKKK